MADDPISKADLSDVYQLIEHNRRQNEEELFLLKTDYQSKIHDLNLKYESEIKNVKFQSQILTNRIENSEKVISHMQNSSFKSVGSHENFTVISFTASATESRPYDEGATLIFDRIVRNYGDFYNEGNGIFTCPANAYYLFSAHISDADNVGDINYEIVMDGISLVAGDAGPDYGSGSTSVMTYCEFAKHVWVRGINNNDRMYGGPKAYASFSGTLLFTA